MLSKIKSWYDKEKRILLYSLSAGLICTASFAVYTKGYSDRIQTGIADEVIRFHIRANSDTESDQNLKLAIKDEILNHFQEGLNSSSNIDETRNFLLSNLKEIEECAKEVISKEGYDYDVNVTLAQEFFPTRKYGDIYLPAGEYEALRINIGESVGENWWCVMFPPLCFVDITKSEIDEDDDLKVQLKTILTEDEYSIVSKSEKKGEIPIEIKFKVVEWWQGVLK